ncbi:hypothetical protein HU200_053894 [Digitaria exilis]|uniref:Uncharacterized protein n=1 Tax=Digitaria exilis TaxID=1010633 RepID=A0A835AQX8_9POAL|nr:hypothetical protein HU200_053894 [Digitaria exilis]
MKKDNAATRAAFLKMKLDQEEVIQRLSSNPRVSGTIPSPDPCKELLSLSSNPLFLCVELSPQPLIPSELSYYLVVNSNGVMKNYSKSVVI